MPTKKKKQPSRTPAASRARRAAGDDPIDKAVRNFAVEAARMAADDHCEGVLLLDVRGLSLVSDYLVIASGTSDRQMRSVLDHVEELGAAHGYTHPRVSKDERATWLLADFGDVVVHLFEPNMRAHYDLEMMWGDAKRVRWQRRSTKADRNLAGLTKDDVLEA